MRCLLAGLGAALLWGLAGCSSGSSGTQPPPPPPPATGLVLSSSANPAATGTPFTLTATVTPSGAEGGFEFDQNGSKIGAVSLATGTASLSTTATQVGTLPYSALFDEVAGGPRLSAALNVAVGTPASATTCGLGTSLLVVNGTSESPVNVTYSATSDNQSAVCVQGAGSSLTLTNPTINKGGNALSSLDPSGVDSAVLAYGVSDNTEANATITVNGGTITSAGNGAYAAFATGAGSSVTLSGTTIAAGFNAVGASMAGQVALINATVTSSGSSLVAINGSGNVTVTNSTLAAPGGQGANGAIAVFSNLVPGASSAAGKVSITGGSLNWTGGPLISVLGGESATISLSHVAVTLGDQFIFSSGGTGTITILADGVALGGGSQYGTETPLATLSLMNHSTFKGQVGGASLTLDASSLWMLTGGDTVEVLSDAAGISGASLTNIVGNGNNATYDSANSPAMGGKTYSLVGGGTLAPK